MIIKYTNFSDGIHHFRFEEPVERLGLDKLFFGHVFVDCKMDKSIHQVVLDSDITINKKLLCDRCASDYEAKLHNHFQLSFLFAKNFQQMDSLNVKYLSPDDDKIDISKDVFEYAELSIPMKNLCKEDCKGLCQKCGINLNEKICDCRLETKSNTWEPLKKLKI